MKRLALFGLLLAVFAGGVAATFPTETIVRLALGRLPPALANAVEQVGAARLGRHGLTLEDLRLRADPAGPPLELRSVSLRPSLVGIVTGRGGRPWHVALAACDGTARATFDRTDGADALALRFDGIDLGPCLAPFEPRGPVTGRASGEATLTGMAGGLHGAGTLTLTDARWDAERIPRHVPLRAEEATLRWRLDGAFHIDEFTARNDELVASGNGIFEAAPAGSSRSMAVRVRIEPTRDMPQAHRDLLNRLPGSPPDTRGGRTYAIGGSLDAPQLGMP